MLMRPQKMWPQALLLPVSTADTISQIPSEKEKDRTV